MSETSGGLPLMAQTQNSRYLTFNEAMWALDVLQTGVLDRDLTSPPGSPQEGDAYIVNGTATGVWAGHENEITFYFGGVWNFLDPGLAQGDGIYVVDEGVRVRWAAEVSPPAFEILTVGTDASTVTYTPLTLADWDGGVDPGNADDALDQLAERVKDLESGGGGGGGLVLLESHTASSSSSLDFTTRNAAGQSGATFQSDFDEYLIEIVNITPATDNVTFSGRLSTDGGSSWISTSSYAHAAQGFNRFGAASAGSDSDSKFEFIYSNSDNSATSGICGTIRFYDPLSTTKYKRYCGQLTYLEGTGVYQGANCHGTYLSTGDVDAIRFYVSSGNIASGTIRVYGVAK